MSFWSEIFYIVEKCQPVWLVFIFFCALAMILHLALNHIKKIKDKEICIEDKSEENNPTEKEKAKKEKVKIDWKKIKNYLRRIKLPRIVFIFGALVSIALGIYIMREDCFASLINGHLARGLFYSTVILFLIWGLIIYLFPKKDRFVTPIRILFVGTFLAATFYFIPISHDYIIHNNGGEGYWGESILTSMQIAFRLFILDGELFWIFDLKNDDSIRYGILADPAVRDFYTSIGSILYFTAPLLTFSFVLTFFNNLISKIFYLLGGLFPTHVFNELNEKSIALASDIRKQKKIYFETDESGKRRLKFNLLNIIVFTEITDKVREEKMELVEDANMLSAILFNQDFDSIKYRGAISARKLKFYLISDDESKKLRHAEIVMKNYDYQNVEFRYFSPDIRSQLLMDSFNPQKMRVIRIDDIQTLIYHNLYTHGKMLFDRARTVEGEKDKVISVVIVGLGQYGREMLKALTWFCQLDGYKLKINAFDSDEKAEEKFRFMCPELMHEDYNGKRIVGEPYYEIKIVGGIDVSTPTFMEQLQKITDASYIFVCLGTDEINLKTAVEIRAICESINYGENAHKPDIETVVYDSKLAASLRTTWEAIAENKILGVINHKDKAYNILITGDLESFYSVTTLIDSELLDAGFDTQLGFETNHDPIKKKDPVIIEKAKRSFWRYEYSYNSSIARAIHDKLRSDMGVPREFISDEKWKKMSRKAKIEYANPEHIRWNAYMRTKGYSKGVRNDLGKRHHNLVPTHELDDDALEKD